MRRASRCPAGTGAGPIRTRVLRAAGADRFYYLVHGRQRRSQRRRSSPTGRSTAFAPAGWRVVDTYGDPRRPGSTIRSSHFEPLSDRYVDRRCGRTDGGARDVGLHRPRSPMRRSTSCRAAQARPDDDTDPGPVPASACSRPDGQIVCTRYEGNRERGLARPATSPTDGRRLPALDDEFERITIVPAAPIERLIVYRPTDARLERHLVLPHRLEAGRARASATAIRTGRSGSGRARASTRAA